MDITCGSGYGSYMIAKESTLHVIGADYDRLAIKNVVNKYLLPNFDYRFGDATCWEETTGESAYDCIIRFDTIEHVAH